MEPVHPPSAAMPTLHPVLEPVVCRGITIPGRVVLAPVNTGFASCGRPDARLLRFHRTRSGKGIAVSFVGNVALTLDERTNDGTPVLDEGNAARFSAIARAIRGSGSLPGVQLASSPAGLRPRRNWRTKDAGTEVDRLRRLLQNISVSDLRSHLSSFVRRGALAVACGFDVIQIHAAHGYLLSLLLDDATNARKDSFGPGTAWLPTFIDDLRAAVGDRLLSVRVSVVTGLRSRADDVARGIELAKMLASHGVDVFDVSAGLYTLDRRLIYPTYQGVPAYLDVAAEIAAGIDALVVVAGGLRELGELAEAPPNVLFALGRPLLADPAYVSKYVAGDHEDIRHCCSSGQCHFFTRGRAAIECGQNPGLGLRGE